MHEFIVIKIASEPYPIALVKTSVPTLEVLVSVTRNPQGDDKSDKKVRTSELT